jgi:diguanylate cyclase (GGDEF)-like protein/PAS domain S-box-containing protein
VHEAPARLKRQRPRVDTWHVNASLASLRRNARVLLAALLLYTAIFSARFVDVTIASGLTVLYVLPIVLVAVELGRRAGIVAGVIAFGLFAAWARYSPTPLPPTSYFARGAAFLVVGIVAGGLADRLRIQSERVRACARHFELARDLFCTASFDGYFTQLNGSWERCLGWTPEELMARPYIDFVHPDDRERTELESEQTIQGAIVSSFTNRYRTKDGSWRWIEWSSQIDPGQRTIYAAARDVTERHFAERQLRFLAEHDPLSGIYNRRRFEQELEREIDYTLQRGSRSAVLLLDVDAFKTINDSFGHATGDAVIAQIGALLRSRLRSGDVVARLGGDEFAVLLRRVDIAAALELAAGLQTAAGAGVSAHAGDPVTLSVGVAPIQPGEPLTVDTVLGRADRAMYVAKRRGGNGVSVSTEPERSADAGSRQATASSA